MGLEDLVADVIGKAQRGLGIDDDALLKKAGILPDELEKAREGDAEAAVYEKIGQALDLSGRALAEHGRYLPKPVQAPGLVMFTTPFEDMTVNSYLVADPASKEAVAFDTGADCSEMLTWLKDNGYTLTAILLTHTHGDHIYDLDRLKEKSGAEAYVSSLEPVEGAEVFEIGREFRCGTLRIESHFTGGHSPGGTTYIIYGLPQLVAIVGDALFAGSMGGAPLAYRSALEANGKVIFSLPGDTVLCPGHGPLTTVAEELKNNPFFA